MPSSLVQITAMPAPIHISRGGINVIGVNFGVNFNFNGAAGLAFLVGSNGTITAMTTTNSQGQGTFAGQSSSTIANDTVVTLVENPGNTTDPATLTVTKDGRTTTVQLGTGSIAGDSLQAISSIEQLVDVMEALATNNT
jgi:hypothetical protein